MPSYQLYILDPNTDEPRRIDLECPDDEAAIEAVAEMRLCEGRRLVKLFEGPEGARKPDNEA